MQTYFAQKAAAYLSKELKTKVQIKGLYFKPFSHLVLTDFLVLDHDQDTLIHTPNLEVKIADFSIDKKFLKISEVELNKGNIFVKMDKNGKSNFDFILNYFSSGTKNKTKPTDTSSFELDLQKIVINDTRLRYKNLKVDTLIHGVNYDDIDAKHFGVTLSKIDFTKHVFQAKINKLILEEKSGFVLQNLESFATIDTNKIVLDQLKIKTPNSTLGNYFAMHFTSFDDFGDFVNKVQMKAHLSESELNSKDLAFFVPEPIIQKMKTTLELQGDVSGLVNHLRIKNAIFKAGKATYINGDFNLKGLPNFDETFMDLNIQSAGTTHRDLNEILGSTIGDKTLIPNIVGKFGNINFKGAFQGYINDFIAYGKFNTLLGNANLDVHMTLNKSQVPNYSGTVVTQGLHVGKIIDDPSMGRVTAQFKINGSGNTLKNLNVKIDGKAPQFYYNNYNYQNIAVNGIFKHEAFNGKVAIKDKNITLNFDGGVDLKNKNLPKFHFDANVAHVDLRALHFMKDSLRISASFKTNFSGNGLSNLNGNFDIKKVEIFNSSEYYRIDSVSVRASGNGKERNLSILSDLLDAQVNGQIDLATIVPYYQSLAKKYIPSLKIKNKAFKPQIFKASLNIKNFAPLARFVAKGFNIEEGATLVGDFNSEKGVASLNGFIQKVQYNDISVNNIIIDQTTSDTQMEAVITSDKIQLNDSASVKNLNLSYKLRNDSLSMNLKLTDELEYNKADLNSLIEFSSDGIARLSILPSLLYVNNEEWHIEDKADIHFGNGAVFIRNLEVGNNNQHILVNGAVSENEKDPLQIEFKNFLLSSLNPITKAFGVRLKGALNGKTKIFGITKTLKIQNQLEIDSLTFNDRLIGKLIDTSSYNHELKKAKIFTTVNAFGEDNIKLDGDLDLTQKQVHLEVHLKEAELVIFEPFVKDFVSELDGNISTDVSINGDFDSPIIKGNINLDEALFKFNILGTKYLITDNINIDNSILRLGDFEMLDSEGHLATARGIVNMKNIADPKLNIFITAKNFMALNTTAKDNDSYYGKAYATSTPDQPIHIYGTPSELNIDVNAKSETGTVINLPLNAASTVSDKDFIEYIGRNLATTARKARILKGLQMNFNLQVDPNSTVKIYTILGNLTGQGNGNITMNINTLGDFAMNGEYIIEHGSFNLIKGELINKQFNIKKGGTIRWTGNPMEAQISNLSAVYDVRTTLKELYTAANRTLTSDANGQRVETEVNMLINGTLSQPSPILSLSFPNNPGIKDDLQTYLSDQNNVNLQAFSLILRRSFSPNTNAIIGQNATAGLANYTTELLFTQVTTAFNQLVNSNVFDINIRSLSDANAGLKLMNGRFLLSGGVINNTNSSNSASLSGVFGSFRQNTVIEAEASYLIHPDGGFIAKLGYKPPVQQDLVTQNAPTRLNVFSPGVIFNTQFESFKELKENIFGKKKKRTDTLQVEDKVTPMRRQRRFTQNSLKDRIEEFEKNEPKDESNSLK